MAKEKIILTGDRPTGRLHIGHYVGSLRRRVELQNSGLYDKIFIFIADAQALTDNMENPEKVRQNVIEVALDYLACGLDPTKSTIFIQSQIPELCELTFYYMDLVTVSRLQRNPTVKTEIQMRNFETSIPVGFFTYPISQAADITAFRATTVPVGEDQEPMIEQAREIVRRFNYIYGETLVEPEILLPDNAACLRLPGTDASQDEQEPRQLYLSFGLCRRGAEKGEEHVYRPRPPACARPRKIGRQYRIHLPGCLLPSGTLRPLSARISESGRTESPLPTWRSGRHESEEVPQRNYAGDTGAYPQPPQGV